MFSFHSSEDTDTYSLTEVILHGVTTETMSCDLSELHSRPNSKLSLLDG